MNRDSATQGARAAFGVVDGNFERRRSNRRVNINAGQGKPPVPTKPAKKLELAAKPFAVEACSAGSRDANQFRGTGQDYGRSQRNGGRRGANPGQTESQ